MTNEFEGPIGSSLQRHADELLDAAPATKGGQVELNATKDGAAIEGEANIGRGWSTAATVGWVKQQGWGFAAKVRKVWGAK